MFQETNAGVVWGFHGSPFNDANSPTAALFSDCTAFATGVGGTCAGTWDQNDGNAGTTLTAQLPFILSNRAYINFHTVQFGGGEVRGTLQIPEPGSLALISAGALALIGFGAFRKRQPAK